MADVFSKEKRSEVMSRIRGKGNKDTELKMINIFRKYQISGWRRNQPLLGKPDFVFRRQRLALFVDGCFWHCCPDHSKIPENNREFWEIKLHKNIERDKFVSDQLKKRGWKVERIWEHELKDPSLVAGKLFRSLNTTPT